MITIFTPSYNRQGYLTRIYKSLLAQSDKEFEWIVVDDGSQDGTSDLIKSFINEGKIAIKYAYAANGGKHRAINIGARLAKGEWFFFLDSDDWLKREAVHQINLNIRELKDKNKEDQFFALIGLCELTDGKIIGTTFEGETLEIDYFTSVLERGINGDKAWTVKTQLLREYPFPEFKGEKFLTEATWLTQMASLNYKCWFYNVSIKIVEYLEDGLSAKYYALMAECWQGTLEYYNHYFRYMVENGYDIMGFFRSYLMIAEMARKSCEQIIDGIEPNVYRLYKDEINRLLQNRTL